MSPLVALEIPTSLSLFESGVESFLSELTSVLNDKSGASLLLFQEGKACDATLSWTRELEEVIFASELEVHWQRVKDVCKLLRSENRHVIYCGKGDCLGSWWYFAINCSHRWWFDKLALLGLAAVKDVDWIEEDERKSPVKFRTSPAALWEVQGIVDCFEDCNDWRQKAMDLAGAIGKLISSQSDSSEVYKRYLEWPKSFRDFFSSSAVQNLKCESSNRLELERRSSYLPRHVVIDLAGEAFPIKTLENLMNLGISCIFWCADSQRISRASASIYGQLAASIGGSRATELWSKLANYSSAQFAPLGTKISFGRGGYFAIHFDRVCSATGICVGKDGDSALVIRKKDISITREGALAVQAILRVSSGLIIQMRLGSPEELVQSLRMEFFCSMLKFTLDFDISITGIVEALKTGGWAFAGELKSWNEFLNSCADRGGGSSSFEVLTGSRECPRSIESADRFLLNEKKRVSAKKRANPADLIRFFLAVSRDLIGDSRNTSGELSWYELEYLVAGALGCPKFLIAEFD